LENAPSFEEFKRDPARYSSFWRTWWECEDCRTDSTPPAVSISSPHDGDVLSGLVLVTADATDNVRLGTVSIRVDGIELAALAAPPYSVAWDTRRVPNGIHELSALATDAVGNAQLSGATQVHVDNDITPPRLTVSVGPPYLWPPDGQFVPVHAFISVSDDRDAHPTVNLTSISCDDGCDIGLAVSGATLGTDDLDFSLAAARFGTVTSRTYTVTYAATDAAGNRSQASAKVVVPHDRRR
jgi:hypothetical protein